MDKSTYLQEEIKFMLIFKNIAFMMGFLGAFSAISNGYAATLDLDRESTIDPIKSTTTENAFRYEAKTFGALTPTLMDSLVQVSFPGHYHIWPSASLRIEYVLEPNCHAPTSVYWQLAMLEDGYKKILGQAFSCLDEYGKTSPFVVGFENYSNFIKGEPIFIDISDKEKPEIIQRTEDMGNARVGTIVNMFWLLGLDKNVYVALGVNKKPGLF